MTPTLSQGMVEPNLPPAVVEPAHVSEEGACAPADLVRLVAEITQGNEEALSSLYARTAAQTFSLAMRIVRSKECAQEIVCDVFVHVWNNARLYDAARGNVRAWLAIITRNRAIDRLRKNIQYRSLSEQLVNFAEVTRIRRPDEVLSNFQEGTSVYAGLARLSPLRHMLLGLAFFDGLTHDEIAFGTGLPLGTIKSHVRRSLRALRKSIEKSSDRVTLLSKRPEPRKKLKD